MDNANFAALIANLKNQPASGEESYLRMLTELMNANNHGGFNPEMERMRVQENLPPELIQQIYSQAKGANYQGENDSPEQEAKRQLEQLLRGITF